MSKRIRQYIGILAAVVAYYIVHEGAHLMESEFKNGRCYGMVACVDFLLICEYGKIAQIRKLCYLCGAE